MNKYQGLVNCLKQIEYKKGIICLPSFMTKIISANTHTRAMSIISRKPPKKKNKLKKHQMKKALDIADCYVNMAVGICKAWTLPVFAHVNDIKDLEKKLKDKQ
jgi:hypothetical protein